MITNKRIPIDYWFNKIKWELLIVTMLSTSIYFISEYAIDISVPLSIGVFLGSAIALLLSFKLSQSYDRWWEARKIWGAIVNDSRSLVIQLKSFTKNEETSIIQKMGNRQIGWCYSLSCSLRKQDPLKHSASFITDVDKEKLLPHKNIPLAIIHQHSEDIANLHQKGVINDYQQIQLDATLVRLCESMGKAERIKNTFFPKTYRLTLHVFIYIFLTLLSLSLTELHSLVEIPIEVIISIPFFLLEKIATHIQDPFENKPTDTPMTSISKTIEVNIKQLMESENLPDLKETDKFYML